MGDLASLAATIGTGAAIATSVATTIWALRKTAAETAKLRVETDSELHRALADTAATLAASSRAEIKEVRADVERVRRERDSLRDELSQLWAYVGELTGAMRAAGLKVPPMQPPVEQMHDA